MKTSVHSDWKRNFKNKCHEFIEICNGCVKLLLYISSSFITMNLYNAVCLHMHFVQSDEESVSE